MRIGEHKLHAEIRHRDHRIHHLQHLLTSALQRIDDLESQVNTMEAHQVRGNKEAASFGSYAEN